MSLLCTALLLQVGGAWEELRTLTSGSTNEDLFGFALANAGDLDGDGMDDLLIGSPTFGYVGSGFGPGAVFVHSGATGALLRQHNAPSADYSYGWDVAGGADLDGDTVPDYLVGSLPPTNVSQVVVVHSGATGLPLHQLVPTVPTKSFGHCVAVVGDLDLDGTADLAVIGRDMQWMSQLFLYSGSTGAAIATYALQEGGIRMVALDDLDGDGIPEIAIGSPTEDVVVEDEGVVRILSGATGAEIRRWDGAALRGLLGWSLAAVPDRDGDGARDLLIGEPTLYSSGSVMLISTGTGATLQLWDGAGNPRAYRFGECVGVAGDMDGDRVEEYLMGSASMRIAAAQGSGRGCIQVVSGASGDLLHEFEGKFDGAQLGHVCVGLGDLDQDGLAEVAGGAVTMSLEGGFVYTSGMVQVEGFERFLNPSATELPAAAGSAVALEFDFPVSAAGWEYRFLLSATGDGPTQAGVWIPLTPDALTYRTWSGTYPAAMNGAGLAGALDAAGAASGSFAFAPGKLASLVGRTLYSAAVAFPAGSARPQISSASVRFAVLP